MRKWIILGVTVTLFIIFGTSIYAYQLIRSPIHEQFEKARTHSYELGIVDVQSVDYYFGTDPFYVVQGFNEEGEETILWIKEDFSFHHIERKADGISFEDALTIVTNEEVVKDVLSIKLGFERGLPIYEVVYESDDDRQGYYYVTFSDGTFMKKYLLRKN